MLTTIIILILTALGFATGRVRSDIVALCSLVLLLIFGILTPEEALSGFSNPVVIMMVGLFVIGGGVLQTGLSKMMSKRIVALAGTNHIRLFVIVMIVTAMISGFISNTGTVALMMPIVVSMANNTGMKPAKLLMPLAFASSFGAALTLIASPPNLVIQDILVKAGYKPLSFFSFSPIGIISIIVGIVVLMPLSNWFLAKRDNEKVGKKQRGKSIKQLVSDYGLTDNLSVLEINEKSKAIGKTLAELNINNLYGLTVIEVRRERNLRAGILGDFTQDLVEPTTILTAGDTLLLNGEQTQVEHLTADLGLSLPKKSSAKSTKGKKRMSFYDIGIAEIVLLPKARLVNRMLKDTDLRSQYGLNVMGIKRRGESLTGDLSDIHLMAGDVLLVQSTWERIAHLDGYDEQWVVLGQPLEEASKVTLDYKAPLAAGLMIAMVAMMVFDFIPIEPVTAVIICALLMVITGCFRNIEAAYKTINWESVVLIAAMMPMSVALQKTGASALVSRFLIDSLGNMGPTMLLAGLYITTSILTLFISNTATAIIMSPMALTCATQLGVSPYPFLLSVAVSAGMCFASPFSTPPNAIVMQAGQYKFMDYIKVGAPLQIIIAITMILVLPLIFPF